MITPGRSFSLPYPVRHGIWGLVLMLGLTGCLFAASAASAMMTREGLRADDVVREWRGDYDRMVEDRVIRVLVPYNRPFYFFDKGTARGLTYEAMREFEKFVNKREKTGTIKIKVLLVPTPRNRIFSDLAGG